MSEPYTYTYTDRDGDEVRVIDQHLCAYTVDGQAASVHLGQIGDPVGLAREILAAAGRGDALEVPDDPEPGRDYAAESAEPGGEEPDLATRVDAVEGQSYRLAGQVADLARRVGELSDTIIDLNAGLSQRRDEIEALSSRVAPVEACVEKTENQ